MSKKLPSYDNFYHYNRNYGCRFSEIIYQGHKTVVIENEKLRVSILLDKGTDIIEFLYKPEDMDFMWRSPAELDGTNKNLLTKNHSTGSFLDIYEGGWQELLPNISIPTNYKNAELGFHGELSFLPWKYKVLKDDPYEVSIKFYVRMNRCPLFIEKVIKIKSMDTFIGFEQCIKNEGDEDFKFMWGQHPVVGKPFLDEDCVIDLPEDSIGITYEADFSGNSPFEENKEFVWPIIEDRKGKKIDISKVMPPEAKIAFNVYIKDIKEGWFGITNQSRGLGFGLKWDVNVFRHFLIWYVYRGFYNFPFYGRTYNIGLEPYTAIPANFDEVVKLGREYTLDPGEELRTKYYAITYTGKNRIKGFDDKNNVII